MKKALVLLCLFTACTTPAPVPPLRPQPEPTAQVPEPHQPGTFNHQGKVEALVMNSSCVKGLPQGYRLGVALAAARSFCRYKSPKTTVAGLIGKEGGPFQVDALTYYQGHGIKPLGGLSGVERVKEAYVLLYALGIQESSGRYCLGRDLSAGASSLKAETCEAGPFQQSYNSNDVSSARMQALWDEYKAHPEMCDLDAWKAGVPTGGNCATPPAGHGVGYDFQVFTRKCPSFAAEWAGVVLRMRKGHFGPINRHEAIVSDSCRQLLSQVELLPCE